MSHKNILDYIERKNLFNQVWGKGDTISIPRDAKKVFEMLECDLSPENLTCDGELPRAEVMKRHRYYTACVTELESMVGYSFDRSGYY